MPEFSEQGCIYTHTHCKWTHIIQLPIVLIKLGKCNPQCMGFACSLEGVHCLHSLCVRVDDLCRRGRDQAGQLGPWQARIGWGFEGEGPSRTSRGRPWCRATRLCHSWTWCGFWRSKTLLRSRGRRLISCSKRAKRSSKSTSSGTMGRARGVGLRDSAYTHFYLPALGPVCSNLPESYHWPLCTPSLTCPMAILTPDSLLASIIPPSPPSLLPSANLQPSHSTQPMSSPSLRCILSWGYLRSPCTVHPSSLPAGPTNPKIYFSTAPVLWISPNTCRLSQSTLPTRPGLPQQLTFFFPPQL